MIDIVGKKKWYFAFSALILVPGIIALFLWRLNLGVDFTGGTLVELSFPNKINKSSLEWAIEKNNIDVASIAPTDVGTYLIRTKPLDDAQRKTILETAKKEFGGVRQVSHETIGPIIGAELLRKALISLVVASVAIVFYIAWAFRSVPKPASSWRFGISAIAALLHDVFVVVGAFSIIGHFLAVEVDTLFVTALLTVIGFSVHDTIVVFDRVRENLRNNVGENFADTVNHSIMQTFARSLNTSMTVVFVLLAVLLFGGASLRWFTVALLIGVISGTYSSIFNAAALLVAWQEWSDRRQTSP
ncbi:MAG: protein-export membrane protein SecF [Candidatus Woykebacteria bacterium RBG_16_43_9]|uniref:Protein-export membrane protein SecF n=1 Tax=Candidatus Woykebacteria bacterium RBG_16_43_9 TaxID=1802596 RepID=A0A1G1WDZ5_9BACT|nr:MAG: protein-export membrane protein SecF [Candidatus Woykebacteria bacterium RBG_16_43_9]